MTDWHKKLLEERVIWECPGIGPHVTHVLNNNHSDFYINSDYLALNPPLTREIALDLFSAINMNERIKPDWIITYPPFGLNIGFCLAELFNCKFGFIQSLAEPELYFDLQKQEKVLLCADDIFSGETINKLIAAVEKKRSHIINLIAVVVNRRGEPTFDSMPIISLLEPKVNVWKKEECPLCAANSPVLPARENWLELTNQSKALK